MLKRKANGLQMGEESDQALLLRDAVFYDLVADQEGLDARLNDVRHDDILRRILLLSKGFRIFAGYGTKERTPSRFDKVPSRSRHAGTKSPSPESQTPHLLLRRRSRRRRHSDGSLQMRLSCRMRKRDHQRFCRCGVDLFS